MKNVLHLFTFGLVALALLFACRTKQPAMLVEKSLILNNENDFSPTTLIIMYDSITGKEPLLKAIHSYKAEIIYDYHFIHGMAIKKPDDKTLDEAIAFFRQVKGVVSVERDRIIRLTDPVRPPLLTK